MQAFYITNLNREKHNIVLVDARIAESANYRGRAGDPDFRRGSPCALLKHTPCLFSAGAACVGGAVICMPWHYGGIALH